MLLSFLAMIIALSVQNEVVSVVLAGVCMVTAVAILYRNLALLTSVTTDDLRIGVLQITTIFNICILLTGVIFAVLVGCDVIVFSENGEKMFAMAIVSCVMIFAGIVSPKLPYNRHTGLRLPWTVQDEDTWNVAHITTVEDALDVLTRTGVINSPDYWASKYTALAWLDVLLISAANALTE